MDKSREELEADLILAASAMLAHSEAAAIRLEILPGAVVLVGLEGSVRELHKNCTGNSAQDVDK